MRTIRAAAGYRDVSVTCRCFKSTDTDTSESPAFCLLDVGYESR
jgi:hypothetical protein